MDRKIMKNKMTTGSRNGRESGQGEDQDYIDIGRGDFRNDVAS